tara:strand:- start:23814 stop:24308 length:495 start_codon:yes stop_codon:yes gene_type:complete
VYIQEVHIGSPDFIALKNAGGTSVNLNGYVVFFDDSSSTDVTFTIGNHSIAAGQTLYLSESSTCPAGSTNCVNIGSNVLYDASRGGATYLCSAACSSSTVVDYHAWEATAAPPTALYGVSFLPTASTGITSANQNTNSFLRVQATGTYPTFNQSDWSVGAKTTP